MNIKNFTECQKEKNNEEKNNDGKQMNKKLVWI